jgi:outer membrane protein assembly factor BamB
VRLRLAALLIFVAVSSAACSSSNHAASQPTTTRAAPAARKAAAPLEPAQRALRLPPVKKGPVPGYVLIADRNNNRAVIVSPAKRVVWIRSGLRGPDDAFFTPGFRSVLTNEEFNDTLTEVSLRTKRRIWKYGHAGVPGSSPGYLHAPDDAYRLANGNTSVADIQNCRIVELRPSGRVARILGGSCAHNPPAGFSSPNGDTPLPDGGLLVTEIGGWIDRLAANGRLLWTVRSPVFYPSDAQLLKDGRILVASFVNPGRIVIMRRNGAITWSFGAASGPNELNKPSLAVMWPNGMIAANDDYNHRVIVINPRTKRIVWQYGHTGVQGTRPGYLNKPDGIDLLPSAFATGARAATGTQTVTAPKKKVSVLATKAPPPLTTRTIGSLPQATSRIAAVALPGGKILALGGLAGGTSSDEILRGPPSALRVAGRLPVPTHDAAAALVGRYAYLLGGGEAVSTDAVVRVDPASGKAVRRGSLGEPLSDLGAAVVGGRAFVIGGYTGTKYATGVLRFRPGQAPRLVTRLPVGLRYAAVAAQGQKIYVAGGLAQAGETRAVFAVDPGAGAVRRIATLPFPVAHAALAALNGSLYLIGGRSSTGSGLASVLRIDPTTGKVSRAGRLVRPLQDPAAVTLAGKIVVIGGAGSSAVLALAPKS